MRYDITGRLNLLIDFRYIIHENAYTENPTSSRSSNNNNILTSI